MSEAAARLEVSRTTIYEWARATRLIAWKTTKRGLRIPAGQILGAGRVVPGLKRCCGRSRRPRTGLGGSDTGMGVRRDRRAAARFAQAWPYRRSAGRGAGIRRQLHMSGGAYRRSRVEPVSLTAPMPTSYRIMASRHRSDPLGTTPADSRFCTRNGGSTVLYAAPEFATAFVETVVRDRFTGTSKLRGRRKENHGSSLGADFDAAGRSVDTGRSTRGRLHPDRRADRYGECAEPCGRPCVCEGHPCESCRCRWYRLRLPPDWGGCLCRV